MVNVSTQIANLLDAGTAKLVPRLTIHYGTSPHQIITLSGDHIAQNGVRLCGGADVEAPIGQVVTRSLVVNTADLSTSSWPFDIHSFNFWRRKADLIVGVYDNTGTFVSDVSLGEFLIIDAQSDRNSFTFTLVEELALQLDVPYSTDLVFPCTPEDVLNDVTTQLGITLTDSSGALSLIRNRGYNVESNPADGAVTYRHILSYLALLVGGNFYTRYNNTITLTALQITRTAGCTLTEANNLISRRYDRSDCYVKYFRCIESHAEETDVEGEFKEVTNTYYNNSAAATAEYPVIDISNPLWKGHEELGISKIYGLMDTNYKNCELEVVSDFRFEYLDVVKFDTDDIRQSNMIVTSYEITFDGKTTLKSKLPFLTVTRQVNTSTAMDIKTAKESAKADAATLTERSARIDAIAELQRELEGASGLYLSTVTTPSSGTIYFIHDMNDEPVFDGELNDYVFEDSTIVYRLDENAFSLSNDGGQTYPYALTSYGNAILNQIYTIGLNADYITSGYINADRIQAGSLNGNKIQANTIDVNKLNVTDAMADAIFAKDITATGTITGAQLSGGRVDGTAVYATECFVNDWLTFLAHRSDDEYLTMNVDRNSGNIAAFMRNPSQYYPVTFQYLQFGYSDGKAKFTSKLYTIDFEAMDFMWNGSTVQTMMFSDTRLKSNVTDTEVDALSTLNDVDVIQFEWNGKNNTQDGVFVPIGFSANQLESVIPESVTKADLSDKDDMEIKDPRQIDSTKITPYTVKAIQQLSAKIDEQQKQIDEQQKQIDDLKKLVNKLMDN